MARKMKVTQAIGVGGLRMPNAELARLDALQPAPYNPRRMPPAKMAALKASLAKHGLVLNLVVQRQSEAYGPLVIVGGHQRVTAMRQLCEERGWAVPEKVSVVVLDLPDAEAKQLNVALNNIEGENDPYKLGALFAEIRPEMTTDDVLATGLLMEQIDESIALLHPPPELPQEDVTSFAQSVTLSVEFGSTKERDDAKALLRAAVKEGGRKAGSILLEALRAQKAAGKLGRRRRAA